MVGTGRSFGEFLALQHAYQAGNAPKNPEDAKQKPNLRSALEAARAYVEEAVDANGGIKKCPSHMRKDLEDIDKVLAGDEPASHIEALKAHVRRLEQAVLWLADVSAATAYGYAERRSGPKSERVRHLSILEKTDAIIQGAEAPSKNESFWVRDRIKRTIAALKEALSATSKK